MITDREENMYESPDIIPVGHLVHVSSLYLKYSGMKMKNFNKIFFPILLMS